MNKIELAKYLSQKFNFDYLNSSIDDVERKRRLAELTKRFESQSNFASVNFSNSGYVEDSNGIPDLDENFAAERALLDIRRHLIRADLEKSLTGQINAKNEITRRNKQRKLEFEESLQKNY